MFIYRYFRKYSRAGVVIVKLLAPVLLGLLELVLTIRPHQLIGPSARYSV